MARYYGKNKEQIRRLIYIVSAILVVVVIVLVYTSGEEQVQPANESEPIAKLEKKSESKSVHEPTPEPEPAIEIPEVIASIGEPNSQAELLIAEAVAALKATPSRIIEARDRLNETFSLNMNAEQREFVREQLATLSKLWLFNRQIYPKDNLCGSYKVAPGDLLSNIGRRYNVPYEILMEINGIARPEALQAGQTIKVINGPFHARIYRSTFTMDLYLKDTYVRSFSVGLGKSGFETPTGLWRVEQGGKLISPTWTDPDTGKTYEAEDVDYPLGSRWIGLEGVKGDAVGRTGFAIHGTKEPHEIGVAGSRGCIRLHNGNAVLMYNLLVSNGSLVEIVN
ncbi:MAG: L,D-transpeptidase family protein [Planctomycetes bacterium]|nr:L,D-transpeptidase family protein [Planctomycetota bacterium]